MKISILTATLNNEDTISDALKSLVSQTYPDIEHIVKDGLSTDKTLDIVLKESPSSIILSAKDVGIYDALNKAYQYSTGEIIGILHADDFFYSPDILQKVIDKFNTTDYDAVYGDLKYVHRMYAEKTKRTWISGEYREGLFLKGWMPPHTAFFVRRQVIEKYGLYNLDFKSSADYEWMLRLIHKNRIKLAYIPEILVGMRTGGQSNKSIKNRILANLEDRKAWKVNGLKPKWFTLWVKPLRKLGQYMKIG